jgi:hypothetical protein
MSLDESAQILTAGGKKLSIVFSPDSIDQIVGLSQGFPHYTHLLALHSVRACIDHDDSEVLSKHVDLAIRKAVEDAQQSLKSAYYKAVSSPRKDALHAYVLLACALAEPDQFGYFAAGDVRDPLDRITGKTYDFGAYAKHLRDFCGHDRGEVLLRTGVPHKFRFRFRNPLMQPLVIMQGLLDKRIDRAKVEEVIGHRGA